jgi:hypothetical protein
MHWEGDVRDLEVAWNRLCYGSTPLVSLQIALFIKKWPTGGTSGVGAAHHNDAPACYACTRNPS